MIFNLVLARIFSIILGLLFVITAGLKFKDLKGFVNIVKAFGLLPSKLSFLGYLQPFIEFIIGVMLIFESKMLLYSFLALGSMGIATIFLVYALMNNKKMDNCGCYGTAIKVPVTWKKVVENLIWMLLILYVLIAYL